MRSRWAIWTTLAVMGAFAARSAAESTLLRQTSERDGHRELEFGLFGWTLYQPHVEIPDLKVSDDFRRELDRTGLKNVPLVDAHLGKTYRIIGPSGVRYSVHFDFDADPETLLRHYEEQLVDSRRIPVRSGATQIGESLLGLGPDGATRVRIMVHSNLRGGSTFSLSIGNHIQL